MKKQIIIIILAIMAIAGCNSTKVANTESLNESTIQEDTAEDIITSRLTIEETEWVLIELGGQKVGSNGQGSKQASFTLKTKENRIGGNTGCNNLMGTYQLEKGNRIQFSQLATTKMACLNSEIIESEFLKVFELTDNYTITENKLMLNVGKRAALAVFVQKEPTQEPIVEKYWKLIKLKGQEVKMVENQEREIYFMLKTEDNRVKGFAGCNDILGSYELMEGNRIKFMQMGATLKLCTDVEVNESEFLKIFELVDNYTIVNDVLSLNVGRRAPLAVFEAIYF